MNRKGLAVGVIVLFIVSSILPMSIGSHVIGVENDEYAQEKQYREYMNDWFVHPNNLINATETQGSGVQTEGADVNLNHQDFKPVDGPMDSAWPMQSHDVRHTGRSPYSTEINLGNELWRFKGQGPGEVWSSAVIDENNIIYFGTLGSDSSLYALHPNGTRKWKYHTDGLIWSTPAIAEDGTIYVTTWGGNYGGYLFAIRPAGTMKWVFWHVDSIGCSPTIGSDGTIYFGTMAGYFFAVNPNGTEQWRLYLGGNLISSPAIGTDNIIYIGTTSHYLYAVNPNGTLRWQFGAGQFKGNPSIADDGIIYAPSFDGYLYAMYPNGTMKWRASTGGSVSGAGVALAEDGIIYIGTEMLRAFYPNGTLKWSADVQGDIYGTVPAVSADGTIYVSAGGSLVAVNSDGTERWRKQLTIAQIHSSPCIGPDDRVYVGSEDYGIIVYGYLHAFGLGQQKNITIEEPHQGHRYLFSIDMGATRTGKTVVIGSVKIKIKASIEQEIDHVDFIVEYFREVEPVYWLEYTDTDPPFEWTMKEHYGNDIFPRLPFDHLSIWVIGWYKGGCCWDDKITNFWYFHLLKN